MGPSDVSAARNAASNRGLCGDARPTAPRRAAGPSAETNGVEGEYGLELVWGTERIAEDNARFRASADFAALYMPFGGLVFFSDAGNGDQFALALSGNQEVYVWNHDDDSRIWGAPTVMRFSKNG